MLVKAFAHWRRLDVPGRDACWLERDGDLWTLYGAALFSHQNGPAFADYNITYDNRWSTLAAHLRGRIGAENFEYHIKRDGPDWSINGGLPVTIGADQLDLGFTPATNYAHLQRLPERGADLIVAWFDLDQPRLKVLPQIYRPAGHGRVDYQSPEQSYAAVLSLADNGFIAEYPGLWSLETDREPVLTGPEAARQ